MLEVSTPMPNASVAIMMRKGDVGCTNAFKMPSFTDACVVFGSSKCEAERVGTLSQDYGKYYSFKHYWLYVIA